MTKSTNNSEKTRPPVVVILGHVDHGKTTILDAIRKTKVVDKEAGGITQHIGAYQIEHEGKKITFLDTPGHEAFTAIRSRGAKVADVAVLVVAAEEGVKPQTKESIKIVKEAKLPFVVAINKIDKEGANIQKVRQELAEQDVLVEGYGGSVPEVEISAKQSKGLDHLLEIILLSADLEELKYEEDGFADGFIIESHIDSRRGMVATLLVLKGTLNVGDYIHSGSTWARVKSLENFRGEGIQQSLPADPCIVLGWSGAPNVGATFEAVESKAVALSKVNANSDLGPQVLFKREWPSENQMKVAYLIIKSDVQSSLEAIDKALSTISSDEVKYEVVEYGVGKIIDGDVKKGKSSSAAVLGFHVPIDKTAKQLAERDSTFVETYEIIYELVENVRKLMSDKLDPEIRKNLVGKIKILATFGITGRGQIVGGKITEGKAVRGSIVDVYRGKGEEPIVSGRLAQLQQGKQDVAEVSEGNEVGVRFESQSDMPAAIREGDILVMVQEETIKRSV